MNKQILMLAAMAALAAGCAGNDITRTVDGAIDKAAAQAFLMAEKYAPQDSLLPKTFENGKDVSSDSRWWCSGFFPGELWYLYEDRGGAALLSYAKEFTARVEREKFTTDNHDVGFILNCSFGNGWRLTGDSTYAAVLVQGAKSLATRFNPKLGVIRSWDGHPEWQYPVIIDNMMNLELLMEASEITGDSTFRAMAISHADKTMKWHFRPDYSSWHVVSYDTLTCVPEKRQTHQGCSDESAWSRGQSWGLYGFTAMYRWTGFKRYLTQAVSIADFLIGNTDMPSDGIPYWDFDCPDIPNTPRDASAAAIMASALVELSDFVDGGRSEKYLSFAEKQLKRLASDQYTAKLGENGCFILKHSVGAFPLNSEVDVPLTYADYYYVEALTRLKKKLNKR